MLERQLLDDSITARRWKRNIDFVDRAAKIWMRSHPDLVLCDADKGLGDIIVHRCVLQQLTEEQLHEGFQPSTHSDAMVHVNLIKDGMHNLIARGCIAGFIQEPQRQYIEEGLRLSGHGGFRIRVKIHKAVPAGRPVCNMARTPFLQAAVWLHEAIQPVAAKHTTVLHSTDDLLQKFDGFRAPANHRFRSSDIISIYPRINRCHLLDIFPDILSEHVHADFARFITGVMRLVLDGIYVEFNETVWWRSSGIPTGLPPCGSIANLYLTRLDLHIARVARSNLSFIARYIDDVIACDDMTDSQCQSILRSWPGNLDCTTSTEPVCIYLDLEIQLAHGQPTWALHTKPLSRFLHLSRTSSHPPSTFKSVVAGCLKRIRKRFSAGQCSRIRHEEDLLRMRLRKRGYSATDFQIAAKKKSTISHTSLVMAYHPCINKSVLHRVLKPLGARVCWKLRPNSFLLRYKSTWKTGWKGGAIFSRPRA